MHLRKYYLRKFVLFLSSIAKLPCWHFLCFHHYKNVAEYRAAVNCSFCISWRNFLYFRLNSSDEFQYYTDGNVFIQVRAFMRKMQVSKVTSEVTDYQIIRDTDYQKLIYLHLSTDCFMKISRQSTGLISSFCSSVPDEISLANT